MDKRMIWDASKVFVRGLAIQYRIRKTKERSRKYKELITEKRRI